MPRWSRISWCLMALACVAAQALAEERAPSGPAGPVRDFAQLMSAFERMPGLEARFVEEKHIGLLAAPLESRGRLFFARPARFLRRVESPVRSEVLITDKQLRVRDDSGERRIDLAARAEVRPFVESLLWLLAGDQKALSTVYSIEFAPARDPGVWQLTLTPKAAPINQLIAHIRVLGSGLRVNEIRVRERGGDESITRILEADPSRRYTPAELASLFGGNAPAARGGKP